MIKENYSMLDRCQIPDCVPWFSEEITEAKPERSKAEKRGRKSQLDSDLAVLN